MADRRPEARFANLADAATISSLSATTLTRLIAAGEIPAYRLNGRVFLDVAALETLIRSRPVRPAASA